MILGERIEELRKDKGLTQEQLGKLIDKDRSVISAYENGLRQPPPDAIKKLAEILDTSTDYLFGLIDNELSYSRQNYIVLPKACSPGFKSRVVDYIEILIKAKV